MADTMPRTKPMVVKKRKHTPESAYFDDLKGELVDIEFLVDRHTERGVLIWVDRYSIGVRRPDDKGITLLYKHSLLSIDRAT